MAIDTLQEKLPISKYATKFYLVWLILMAMPPAGDNSFIILYCNIVIYALFSIKKKAYCIVRRLEIALSPFGGGRGRILSAH